MIVYPKEWLETCPCEYCNKPYSEHSGMWFEFRKGPLCNMRKADFKPLLPTDQKIECECEGWTMDDDIASFWPNTVDYGMSGHMPTCDHYEPPPTVQLTIDKLERRLERLRSYLKTSVERCDDY